MKTCPDCKHALHPRQLGEIEIDECRSCGGTWFDSDELRLAKDASDEDLRWLDFDLWGNEALVVAEASRRGCPACNKAMAAVRYGETDVTVDVCPACRGVWLDVGEFPRIVASLQEEVSSRHLSDYLRASLEEGLEILAGPESLASEWRDFSTVLRLTQYRLLVEKPGVRDALLSVQRANPFK